ncbi:Periplasmic solute binding protein [Sterolibacterium denitrificans]|uniref:Periplasmic solute binding protein n=1 Tax=Sterolibacterium denitrificans TaxID=157592 RepID=A0A7Z7MUD7_9PROT|nr:zinc ABC transporter substrate-binding protein [Sterolibacterium denitrificans]SMB22602.1 Periplasmic solute binding protein [Sterolibacterium denitrificans]
MNHIRSILAPLLLGGLILFAGPAAAAPDVLNVLACEPEWAALTREIAGERAAVDSATTGMQDPHHIEARPALIARARRADLLICTGAELEAGWLPLLQRESANPAIQPGQRGYFEAARYVALIEKPGALDRSQGDIHAAGNPHLHLDPRNLLRVADALATRLAELDPAGASEYAARHADFAARLSAAIARWERQGAALKDVPVLVQHKSWSYLVDWLGLEVVADLEPKPGIEPSAAHLAQVLARQQARPAKMLLRAGFLSPRAGEWIAARTPLRVVILPFTVGSSARARDLFSLYDDILDRLTEVAR